MQFCNELEEISEEEIILNEMARVGFIDDCEIYVRSDDPGHIPHFHIWDRATRGKKFHTCVKILECDYFHHTGKEDVLDSKARKKLCNFFKSKSENEEFNTNWDVLIFMWNINNSTEKVAKNTSMPDYTKLPNKKTK